MWSTFKECTDALLDNIDDFAVIIFILIVGNKLADLLYRFIANFLERSLFTAQAIKLTLQIFIGVISIVHLIGETTINNAAAGIAIGVGYAFQPYIISLFNGLMLHNDNVIRHGVYIDIASQGIRNSQVFTIGLFNTILKDVDDNIILVSNSTLMQSSVVIKNKISSIETQQQADKSEHEDHSRHYLMRQIHHNPAFKSFSHHNPGLKSLSS